MRDVFWRANAIFGRILCLKFDRYFIRSLIVLPTLSPLAPGPFSVTSDIIPADPIL